MKKGFTLFELSMVLVVIGLLIGGVMTGRELIRSSQIRNALEEHGKYLKAISEFRDKYHALPGDMNNAESNWGADDSCPTTVSNTNPKIATCNGDGNGHIGDSDVDGALTVSREWFRAWQQLGDAGVIEGHYTGTPGPNNDKEAMTGTNIPKSALSGAGWTMLYYLLPANGSSNDKNLWRDQYGHILALGAAATNSYTTDPVLTPIEASVLDDKMDDGKPGTGKIRVWRITLLPNCTDEAGGTQTGTIYKITETSKACSLVFITGF